MALILVIEDDPQFRLLVQRILTEAKHQTVEASDGEEGLQMFQKHRPDLVLVDILMPVKEGVETIRDLRRFAPAIKIVAMSGGGRMRDNSFLQIAMKLGADEALPKPFRPQQLIDTISRLLD